LPVDVQGGQNFSGPLGATAAKCGQHGGVVPGRCERLLNRGTQNGLGAEFDETIGSAVLRRPDRVSE
jgi:hypothetical protein